MKPTPWAVPHQNYSVTTVTSVRALLLFGATVPDAVRADPGAAVRVTLSRCEKGPEPVGGSGSVRGLTWREDQLGGTGQILPLHVFKTCLRSRAALHANKAVHFG